MKSILPQRPPSQGYAALARLVALSAFDVILSLNPDDLLEQALLNQRVMLRDFDRLEAMAGDPQWIASRLGSRAPRIKIFKLHGDLQSGKFAFTEKETHRFKPGVRELIQQQLLQDVISFGTSLADEDIRDCLEAPSQNHLWFISHSAPDDYVDDLLAKRGSSAHHIAGPEAEFDRFFPRLLGFVEGSRQEPGAEYGGNEDRDLSRIWWLGGPYGYGPEGIFLGSQGSIAAFGIADLRLANCKVNVGLRIIDHGDDESNWVGCQVRANSSQYGDGFLVYLRASGNIDLYSRLPGFDGIIETVERTVSPHDWNELEFEIHANRIEVLVNGRSVIVLEGPNVVEREGYIFLLSHFTKSYLSHLRVSPL
jgi:hypothetical protein